MNKQTEEPFLYPFLSVPEKQTDRQIETTS